MASHYSITSFFRQTPNILLARYFERRELFGGLDFAAMRETNPKELFTAWLALPEEQRNAMEAEFRDIFELSCEKGFRAIIDEASLQLQNDPKTLALLIDELSELPSHFYRAMVAWLDHHEFWKGATHFHHADRLPYWRKRKNMGHEPAAVDDESVQRLARLIRSYFHQTEGRGQNCVVEPFRRGGLDYFFAYPEDY